MSGGLYVLVLDLAADVRFTPGALGVARAPAGRYLYIGSARRGLDARVRRHRRREKPLHWHIDYLTTNDACAVTDVIALSDPDYRECDLCRALISRLGVDVPIPRFGATDCRAGCPAHLVRVSTSAGRESILGVVAELSACHDRPDSS